MDSPTPSEAGPRPNGTQQSHPSAGNPSQQKRFVFKSAGELINKVRKPDLVSGVIRGRPQIGVIGGAPGSGKTYLALDLAFSAALKKPWLGRRVRQCQVAYIAAEGSLQDRLGAYLTHNDLSGEDIRDLVVLEDAPNFLADATAGELNVGLMHAPVTGVGLIIIDTLSRVMPGGDEKGIEDLSLVLKTAQTLAEIHECPVLFIHHPGKEQGNRLRGHSSLLGALDFELQVSRTSSDPRVRQVTVAKQRDAEDNYLLGAFKLQYVSLGKVSEHDDQAESDETYGGCVVVPCDITGQSGQKLSKQAARALDLLHECFDLGKGKLPPVEVVRKAGKFAPKTGQTVCPVEVLREHVKSSGGLSSGDKPDSERTAIKRALDALQSKKIIRVFDDWIWLTDMPDKGRQR